MHKTIRVRPTRFGHIPIEEYINKRVYPVSIVSYEQFDEYHYKVTLQFEELKPLVVWKEDIDCLMKDQDISSPLRNVGSVNVGDNSSVVINGEKGVQNVDIINTRPPCTSPIWKRVLKWLIAKVVP